MADETTLNAERVACPECAEGGHINDDNPTQRICQTCADDPEVAALYGATEWAVRWYVDPQPTYEFEQVKSESEAQRIVDLYPSWNGEAVFRTVTYGEWRLPPGSNGGES